MPSTSIAEAAALLVAIRRAESAHPAELPAALKPRDENAAYAIQQAVLRQLDVRIGGWKAAMPDVATMLSAPIAAPTLRDAPAHLTPATTATRGTRRWGIEPEIAFRLRRALPPRSSPWLRDEVLDAVDSAHAAIEVCASRFIDDARVPPLDRLADSLISEGLVLGAPNRDWRTLDLPQLPLRVLIDGKVVHQGRGGHPIGDPLIPLVAIANHLSTRGVGLQEGDVITTGSCNGLRWLEVGQQVQVEFAGLGVASIDFDS